MAVAVCGVVGLGAKVKAAKDGGLDADSSEPPWSRMGFLEGLLRIELEWNWETSLFWWALDFGDPSDRHWRCRLFRASQGLYTIMRCLPPEIVISLTKVPWCNSRS